MADDLSGLGDEPQGVVSLEQMLAPTIPITELRRIYLKACDEYQTAREQKRPQLELLALELRRLETSLLLEASQSTDDPDKRVGIFVQLLGIGDGRDQEELLKRLAWRNQTDLDRAREKPEQNHPLVIRYLEVRVRQAEAMLKGLYIKLLNRSTTTIDMEVGETRRGVREVIAHQVRERNGR